MENDLNIAEELEATDCFSPDSSEDNTSKVSEEVKGMECFPSSKMTSFEVIEVILPLFLMTCFILLRRANSEKVIVAPLNIVVECPSWGSTLAMISSFSKSEKYSVVDFAFRRGSNKCFVIFA